MQSRAATVDQYLAELPEDRRAAISAVRKVILANLDADYEEGMGYGMIGYFVPHRVFPPGYHADPRQPLPFAGLASQKNHMAIYLMAVSGEDAEGKGFREAWAKSGKKLDMGKSCIRFTSVEGLALDVIGNAIRRMPARAWVETYKKLIDNRTPMARSEIAARAAARAKGRAVVKAGGKAKTKRIAKPSARTSARTSARSSVTTSAKSKSKSKSKSGKGR